MAGLSTGKGIAPSSAPCPLWPLFRPENCGRNRDIVVVGGDEVLVLSTGNDASGMAASDPNFEKKPRFLAGWCGCCVVLLMLSLSSLSPTSSNVSDSSGVGGARSKWRGRSLNDALGIRGKRAESRLWRAPGSVILTGLLAEMSNDRLYESNDSREMEKCSISPELLLVSDDARERYFLGHTDSLSTGDGGR